MPSRRRLLWSAASVALVLVAPPAAATPGFPDAIAAELGLAEPPDCLVCHAGEIGSGTVTTPFGRSLRARGLVPGDADSLRTALQALEAEGRDSDGDGVGDVDELRAGADPNLAPGDEGVDPPTYGCASAAGSVDGVGAVAAVLVAVGLAALRRRRRCEARFTGRPGRPTKS